MMPCLGLLGTGVRLGMAVECNGSFTATATLVEWAGSGNGEGLSLASLPSPSRAEFLDSFELTDGIFVTAGGEGAKV